MQEPHRASWTNINSVVGYGDVQALSEIVNLLGTVDKKRNMYVQDVNEAWSNWSDPIICIGGGFKSNQIVDVCLPKLVEYRTDNNVRFALLTNGKEYNNDGVIDSGVLYKGKSATGEVCIVINGLGELATTATAKTFQKNAKRFGKIYGSAGFAAIVQSKLKAGHQIAELIDVQPKPKWYRIMLHPVTYYKWRHLFKD